MPRIYASMTDEFHQAVAGYATRRGITVSAALVELAAIGYAKVMDALPPAPLNQHGGSRDQRTKTEVDIDRIEAQLRGFPPMADDD